jgi:hypothetical protein
VALQDGLQAAIADSIVDACGIRTGKTWEVDVLVGLFRTGLPRIQKELQAALSPLGLTVNVGGVFCHQSPKVDIAGNECEVGDLLFLLRYSTGGTATYNALLLQTKMIKDASRFDANRFFSGRKRSGDIQYRLYDDWPPFHWVRTGARRRVQPPAPHLGAQYAFVDACEQGCSACSIATGMPGHQARPIEAELVDFLFRASGRRLEPYEVARRRRGWDRVVWEIVRGTVRRVAFTVAKAGVKNATRSWGTAVFLARASDAPPFLFSRTFAGSDGDAAALAYAEDLLPPPEVPRAQRGARDDGPDGVSLIVVDLGDVSGHPDAAGTSG